MRVALILFCLISVFCAVAEKPLVVASASIFADMARQVGGDKIDVRSIVPIGGDPHRYEATPADAALLTKAGLILINGLTFEGWINEVIYNSGTDALVTTITKGIEPIRSREHEGATDPHAWMDAENGIVYIRNIRDALIAIDPGNANYYELRYAAYKRELTALHTYITDRIQSIPEEKRILITSHDAFSYFGNKYGLGIRALMGVSTEADAQTSDMKRVIEALVKDKVPALFIESTINPRMLQQIAKDYKVIIGGNLYADSLGEPGTSGDTYTGMLKHNTDVIADALSGLNISTAPSSAGFNPLMYLILSILLASSWLVFIKFLKK